MSGRIQVLLSTYNGERYLSEQLDSLLQQDYPDIQILIRDDGSADGTVALAKKYDEQYPNIRLIEDGNVGIVGSFFQLLLNADKDAEYFAFSDQDDIWLPQKLSRAVEHLHPSDSPRLYASRTQYITANRQPLGYSWLPKRPLGLRHALVQNRLIGCTMVFNRATLKLLVSNLPESSLVHIHDWWVYLVVGALGEVIFDEQATLLYRQHSSNAIGNNGATLQSRINRFTQNQKKCTQQAQALQKCFGDQLDSTSKMILDRFLNHRSTFLERVNYALSNEVYRQEPLNNLILKMLIILDRV